MGVAFTRIKCKTWSTEQLSIERVPIKAQLPANSRSPTHLPANTWRQVFHNQSVLCSGRRTIPATETQNFFTYCAAHYKCTTNTDLLLLLLRAHCSCGLVHACSRHGEGGAGTDFARLATAQLRHSHPRSNQTTGSLPKTWTDQPHATFWGSKLC